MRKAAAKKVSEPVLFEDSLDIHLKRGGRRLVLEADGFIPERFHLEEGTECYVDMHVRVHGDAQILPFMVGGSKGIDLKHEAASDRHEVEAGRWYRLRIQIKLTNSPPDSGRIAGIPHTEYPSNAMRFVEWRDGKLIFYSASLVSQHGQFFLIVQEQYDVHCYDAKGVVRCPYFEARDHQWDQLLAVLPDMFGALGVTLPPYLGQQAEPDFIFNGLASGTAGVDHWDAANGIGGLTLADGRKARVHWTSITRSSRLVYLAPGEIVRVGRTVKPELTKDRPTKYNDEAKDVVVIDDEVRAA
ncbi:MAG: hypothetical protein AAB417_04215 [Patescibacteria group bacterium]